MKYEGSMKEDINLWSWNYITDLIQIKVGDSFAALVVPTLSTLNALACGNMLLSFWGFEQRCVRQCLMT